MAHVRQEGTLGAVGRFGHLARLLDRVGGGPFGGHVDVDAHRMQVPGRRIPFDASDAANPSYAPPRMTDPVIEHERAGLGVGAQPMHLRPHDRAIVRMHQRQPLADRIRIDSVEVARPFVPGDDVGAAVIIPDRCIGGRQRQTEPVVGLGQALAGREVFGDVPVDSREPHGLAAVVAFQAARAADPAHRSLHPDPIDDLESAQPVDRAPERGLDQVAVIRQDALEIPADVDRLERGQVEQAHTYCGLHHRLRLEVELPQSQTAGLGGQFETLGDALEIAPRTPRFGDIHVHAIDTQRLALGISLDLAEGAEKTQALPRPDHRQFHVEVVATAIERLFQRIERPLPGGFGHQLKHRPDRLPGFFGRQPEQAARLVVAHQPPAVQIEFEEVRPGRRDRLVGAAQRLFHACPQRHVVGKIGEHADDALGRLVARLIYLAAQPAHRPRTVAHAVTQLHGPAGLQPLSDTGHDRFTVGLEDARRPLLAADLRATAGQAEQFEGALVDDRDRHLGIEFPDTVAPGAQRQFEPDLRLGRTVGARLAGQRLAGRTVRQCHVAPQTQRQQQQHDHQFGQHPGLAVGSQTDRDAALHLVARQQQADDADTGSVAKRHAGPEHERDENQRDREQQHLDRLHGLDRERQQGPHRDRAAHEDPGQCALGQPADRPAQQQEEGAETEADQGGAVARGQAQQPGRHHAEAAECGKHAQGFARQDANLASGQRVFRRIEQPHQRPTVRSDPIPQASQQDPIPVPRCPGLPPSPGPARHSACEMFRSAEISLPKQGGATRAPVSGSGRPAGVTRRARSGAPAARARRPL